ncbi:hypothetical protein OIU74_005160 [Salix koriyanagi]|uniref:Uncharacterized protein n=1 Tax=Salix koriyanagi TaxID=2511006 RepID=A0A9Q0ZG73_9ROSI|nr:hypothetical protein OIU74_005160 [Salix koriyanagi]
MAEPSISSRKKHSIDHAFVANSYIYTMGDTQELAAWVCKEEARGLICLQFEESATAPAAHPRDSNASYYR